MPFRRIVVDVDVEAAEIPEMAEVQMARDSAFPRFAKRDQVVRIEFEIGMEMERPHVMHLQLVLASADFADWVKLQVLRANGRPMLRTGVRDRMLALGSIDKMANDGHKKARAGRASGGIEGKASSASRL